MGKRSRKAIRQWFGDCRAFFSDTAEACSRRNWEILHPMALVYLAYLCFYLLVVCPLLGIPEQTAAVRIFAALHGAFTLIVFLYRGKTPPVRMVGLAISLFAAQILALSGFLAVAVFPGEASFLFPLCLVLMMQIYTRRPIHLLSGVLAPSVVYLILCWQVKPHSAFLLDAVSVSVAVVIAAASLFSSISDKLQTYHAQTALQKMCALDPMTGVNNKPTFEFLAEEYLRSCPKDGYALAVCDFDNFKGINDHSGHRVGDEVLDAFAAGLHRLVDQDPALIAGRFGGDEFVLFAKRYASEEELLERLAALRTVSGFAFPVTCSIGVAFSASGTAAFQQCFDTADRSLYRAKAGGPGRICSGDADAPPLQAETSGSQHS